MNDKPKERLLPITLAVLTVIAMALLLPVLAHWYWGWLDFVHKLMG